MSNINLLPWRLARAQRQKKQFGIMIGLFLAATASLAFAVDWLVQQGEIVNILLKIKNSFLPTKQILIGL